MNRELRFRVWSIKNRCFVTRGSNIANLLSLTYQGEITTQDIYQQYTGVRDIEGTEIYEGDIVKITEAEEDAIDKTYSYVATVAFGDHQYPGSFILINPRFYKNSCLLGYNPFELEIIGNVFETPELLK